MPSILQRLKTSYLSLSQRFITFSYHNRFLYQPLKPAAMRSVLFLFAFPVFFSCNNKKTADKKQIVAVNVAVTNSGFINPDSVLFSFVFMGCNRVEKGDTGKATTNASTANVPELQRTFNEVAALNPRPVYYFFLGDEVLGLNKDTTAISNQLLAWRNQYEDKTFSALPGSGIQLVAIPGNHEMLYEKHHVETPNKNALQAYMNQMAAYMPAGVTINRVGGADSLDNLMTYSFTYNNTHFILINTDTYNSNATIGMAPASWIAADIIAARKDPSVKHIFLLGHKPAVVNQPLYVPDGESTMDVSVVQAIWPVMDSNRVEAMLSAHSHQYDRLQPNANKSYQVIAGNGGSLYEHKAKNDSTRQFFGYTIVYVMNNGQVMLQSMGRSVPYNNYTESIPASLPTTIRDTVNISWGTNAGMWVPGGN
jgi:Calcineurin-like phosphoesterase